MRPIKSQINLSKRTLGRTYSIESTTTKVKCTLESGCGVLYSMSYPGVSYFIVRLNRVWRTIEYATTKGKCTLEFKSCLESVAAPIPDQNQINLRNWPG